MICFIMLFLCHFCIMIVSALFCAQSLRFVFYYYLLGKVVAEVEEEEASEVRAHLRLLNERLAALKGPLAAAVAVEVAEAVLTNTPHKYLYSGELGCHFLVGMRVCMCGCVCV